MQDFCLKNKIYYHDTDAGKVVYYANYLEHLEEGRTEFCLSKGIDLVEYSRKGVIFPIAHLEVDYKAPAQYGDTIEIYTKVDKMGNASLELAQEIKRGDKLLVRAKILWVCVNENMKPQRVPEEIRGKLSA